MFRLLALSTLALVCLLSSGALAAVFEIAGAVINEGGNPREGISLTLTNDALGDAVCAFMVSSSGRFELQPYSGALKPVSPPEEIRNLRMDEPSADPAINWDPDADAEWYNLYREQLWETSQPPPPLFDGYVCRIPEPSTNDPQSPSPEQFFVYLVTAANAYYESTLGNDSIGTARTKGAPCP